MTRFSYQPILALMVVARFALASDAGIQLSSREGQTTLNIYGVAQARYTGARQARGLTSNNFDLALGRLAFEGTLVDPRATYFFQVETSTFGDHNRVNMLDAWIGYSLTSKWSVQTGRFLLPYRPAILHASRKPAVHRPVRCRLRL